MDSELFRRLAQSASGGSVELVRGYTDNFRDVLKISRNSLVRRGRLETNAEGADLVDQVKVAAVLNDVSFLTLQGGKNLTMSLMQQEGMRRTLGTTEVRLSLTRKDYERINGKSLMLGFSMRTDDDEILREISPLIEGGHLIVQPDRIVMYVQEAHADGRRTFNVLDINEGGGPIDLWEVMSDEQLLETMSINGSLPICQNEVHLTEVVLPYLTGTSASDLAKIMNDEADLLSEFRSSLRDLVRDARSKGKDAQEILLDIVGPKVGRLERRFQQIANMNRLKVGGAAVATITLALTSAATGGFVAGAAALVGSSGLLMLAKEYAGARAETQSLKDDPTYLLWKFKKQRS